MSRAALFAIVRHDPVEVLPAMPSVAPRQAAMTFEAGDPESEELKRLLEACVVGPYRLRLREQLRAIGGCEHT
jgi:hypothetical protein